MKEKKKQIPAIIFSIKLAIFSGMWGTYWLCFQIFKYYDIKPFIRYNTHTHTHNPNLPIYHLKNKLWIIPNKFCFLCYFLATISRFLLGQKVIFPNLQPLCWLFNSHFSRDSSLLLEMKSCALPQVLSSLFMYTTFTKLLEILRQAVTKFFPWALLKVSFGCPTSKERRYCPPSLCNPKICFPCY